MIRGNPPLFFLPEGCGGLAIGCDGWFAICDGWFAICDGWFPISDEGTVGSDGGDVGLLHMRAKLLSLESDMFLGRRGRLGLEVVGREGILVRGCMDCKCAAKLGASNWGGKLLSIEGNKFVWKDVPSWDKSIVYNCVSDTFLGNRPFLCWFESSICLAVLKGSTLPTNWLVGDITLFPRD